MTRPEWDEKWGLEYGKALAEGLPPALAFNRAHRRMEAVYGTRPAGDPGPPLIVKLAALAAGVPLQMLSNIWNKLNGWKTVIGAVITIVAYLVAGIPLVAGLCTTAVCATTVAKAAGIGLTVVGVAHKLYKFVYHENHP